MPHSCSRRSFLKLGSFLLAGGAAAAAALPEQAGAIGRPAPQGGPVTEVKGYCPFCQVRCTYRARVQDGRMLSVSGDPDNRWTGGAMCPKGMSMVELLESPYRITRPMLRGEDGSWRRISYTEAVAMTAARLKEVREKHGAKAGERVAMTMPLWDCLEAEIAALMCLRTVGSVHAMPPGETCVSTASNMLGLMTGVSSGTTQVDELVRAKLIVLWGANVNDLYPPYTRWLAAAREAGATIVYIDPRRTRTSMWCHSQLRPVPGTDGVLACGAIRHLLEKGAYDEARCRFQISDFENLAPQTARYTPDFVQATTGLGREEITAFYEALAASGRTIVWLGGSLSRLTNGILTVRAIILLQALRDSLIGEGRGMLTFQSGKPGGGEELVDHCFGKSGARKMNFRRLRASMEKGLIDVLFLNSSYRRNPDALGVRRAIEKVPFVVHMGFFPDEESEVSTLFIPAAFGPESQGTGYGNENQICWREKIVTAPGECVPAWQFYRDVGRAVDPDRYPDFRDPEALCGMLHEHVPSWKGITVNRMRQVPTLTWPLYDVNAPERRGSVFTEGRLLTPDGTMRVVDRVFGGLDRWEYPKGHPRDSRTRKEGAPRPLILTQGKQLWHWQQTLTNFARSMAQFSKGRFVQVHPETAAALGLRQGERVRLETRMGGLEAWVDITESVLPGTVFTPANCCRTTPLKENQSPSLCNILPNYWDRISAQHNGAACTLTKIGAAAAPGSGA